MGSILIADTTREERERIVAESVGNIEGLCDGCSPGIIEMYQDYIDGKKELSEPPPKQVVTTTYEDNHTILFILDEPDSGLDGVVAKSLFKSLRAIADEGKIVVVITHTPDRVIEMFDDVIVLAKDAARIGRLAYYGSVTEAYEFFGKSSMEDILLSVNQTDEGGEGRADEFVEKYAALISEKSGSDTENKKEA